MRGMAEWEWMILVREALIPRGQQAEVKCLPLLSRRTELQRAEMSWRRFIRYCLAL